jgi:hypothetical protein
MDIMMLMVTVTAVSLCTGIQVVIENTALLVE